MYSCFECDVVEHKNCICSQSKSNGTKTKIQIGCQSVAETNLVLHSYPCSMNLNKFAHDTTLIHYLMVDRVSTDMCAYSYDGPPHVEHFNLNSFSLFFIFGIASARIYIFYEFMVFSSSFFEKSSSLPIHISFKLNRYLIRIRLELIGNHRTCALPRIASHHTFETKMRERTEQRRR